MQGAWNRWPLKSPFQLLSDSVKHSQWKGSTGHSAGSTALLHSSALFRDDARARHPESPWEWATLPHSLLQLGSGTIHLPVSPLETHCGHLSAVFSAFCKHCSRCNAGKVSTISQIPYGVLHRGPVSRSFLHHLPALFLVQCSTKMLP